MCLEPCPKASRRSCEEVHVKEFPLGCPSWLALSINLKEDTPKIQNATNEILYFSEWRPKTERPTRWTANIQDIQSTVTIEAFSPFTFTSLPCRSCPKLTNQRWPLTIRFRRGDFWPQLMSCFSARAEQDFHPSCPSGPSACKVAPAKAAVCECKALNWVCLH